MDDKRKDNRDIEREASEGEANEGEGSKSADRNYRRGVEEFLEEEDPSQLAREAARDVERDPDTYEAAEREGKARIAEEDENDKDLI
jgi:hypothetical protein